MSESSNQPGVAVEPAYLKPPNAPPLPPDPAVNIESGSGIDAPDDSTPAAEYVYPPAPFRHQKAVNDPALDAPDDSTPVAEEAAGVTSLIPGSATGLLDLDLVSDEKGVTYAVFKKNGKTFVLPILGKKFAKYVRAELARRGTIPRKNEVQELIEQLAAMAESAGQIVQVWYRVAPIEGGCVLDMGDPDHTRIRVTAEGVQVLPGCPIHFMRTGTCLAYTRPADVGNRKLLDKYLNLSAPHRLLARAYLTYVLMHPKQPGTVYPILVLLGSEGTGKTALTRNVILPLLDPSSMGVQIFPTSIKDLVVAVQQGLVRAFDNIRSFPPFMSDALCIASTGGSIAVRQLYTNDEVNLQSLHGALILNGISPFIQYPDLAQRCVTLQLKPIAEENRRSEVDMLQEFQRELPSIFRGLLDDCSQILRHLPAAVVTNASRIYEFSRWLAAMELVDGVPAGTYQSLYAHMLLEGQLDSLLEHSLADALFQFLREQSGGQWSGRPEDLLLKLDLFTNGRTKHSPDWPRNAIALSKRLHTLQAGFRTQGVKIDFTRGKHRTITITTTPEFHHDV